VFRALIVLFSYGYNIETCNIIEATFLTLHFCHMQNYFCRSRGAWPKWPNGKYASGTDSMTQVLFELGLPSFNTVLINSHVVFTRSWFVCQNSAVSHVRHIVLLG